MPKGYQSGDITPIRGLPAKSRERLRCLTKLLEATQGEVIESALDYLLLHVARRGVLHPDLQTALLSAEQQGTLSYQSLLSALDDESDDNTDGSDTVDPVRLQQYRDAVVVRCITSLLDEAEFQQRRRERQQRIDKIMGRAP
jgi:hypothetical protein